MLYKYREIECPKCAHSLFGWYTEIFINYLNVKEIYHFMVIFTLKKIFSNSYN